MVSEILSQNHIYPCAPLRGMYFFLQVRVVNVVIAPNAMLGELRKYFESAPRAKVSWWSQCMDGWSGWRWWWWWGVWLGGEEGTRRRGAGVGCVGMCGCVGGWREEGGRRGMERERATDSIEPQNSHKQSLLSGLDQEHPLLGMPMLDFGRGILRVWQIQLSLRVPLHLWRLTGDDPLASSLANFPNCTWRNDWCVIISDWATEQLAVTTRTISNKEDDAEMKTTLKCRVRC